MISALLVSGDWHAEDDRRPVRSADDLVEECQLQLAVALTAELGAEMCCPQIFLAYLLLERVDDLASGLRQWRELEVRSDEVERLDLIADECIRPIQQFLVVRVGFEIPHAASLPAIRVGVCIP